ncbi:MAG: hypothetical protein MnENMB40S_28840 [Rhizobiaceae bacterium MnEN-MB40S]|nr:MAG: hypothetical protein MnENMB40S_28840 [Rhizobiaceae bacterium MnEN-MB40S]
MSEPIAPNELELMRAVQQRVNEAVERGPIEITVTLEPKLALTGELMAEKVGVPLEQFVAECVDIVCQMESNSVKKEAAAEAMREAIGEAVH